MPEVINSPRAGSPRKGPLGGMFAGLDDDEEDMVEFDPTLGSADFAAQSVPRTADVKILETIALGTTS